MIQFESFITFVYTTCTSINDDVVSFIECVLTAKNKTGETCGKGYAFHSWYPTDLDFGRGLDKLVFNMFKYIEFVYCCLTTGCILKTWNLKRVG